MLLLLLLCKTSKEGEEKQESWHTYEKVVQDKSPARLSGSVFPDRIQVPVQQYRQTSCLIRSSQATKILSSKSEQIASLLIEQLHQVARSHQPTSF